MIQTAHILLYDAQGRVLLQQRSDTAVNFPSVWGFFGGSHKSHETPEQAIQRETLEELNYPLKRPQLLAVDEISKIQKGVHIHAQRHIFMAKCLDKTPIKLREGQGMGWFRACEVKVLKMLREDRKVLNQLLASLRRRA